MARSHSGEIIKAGRGAETIGAWINSNMSQIALALPRGTSAERLARVFVTEVQRVPGLLAATPMSLLGGFLQASQCGLEIGAHLGQAYLVPFKVKGVPTATLIIGYKGLVSLAYRSGLVQNVQAYDVRDVDVYEPPMLGTSPEIVHAPARGRESSELVAAYAIVRLRGADVPNVEWMWDDEIERVKKRSRAAGRSDSPWNSDYSMMARKTVLRRALKYVPQTPETRDLHGAVAIDEAADANLPQPFDIKAEDLTPFPEHGSDTGELSAEDEARMEAELGS